MQSVFDNGGIIGTELKYYDKDKYILGRTSSISVVGTTIAGLNTTTLPYPSGIEVGDVLVICAISDATATFAIPVSVPIQRYVYNPDNVPSYAIFLKTVTDTSETELKAYSTTGLTQGTFFCVAFRGISLEQIFDGGEGTGSSSTPLPPPVDLSDATSDCYAICFCFLDDDITTISPPSTFTTAISSNIGISGQGCSFAIAYKQVTPGTVTPGAFSSTTDTWHTYTLGFNAAPIYGNKKNSGIWSLNSTRIFNPDREYGLIGPSFVHSASGLIAENYGPYDTVFAATLVFPESPIDGLIWETGANAQGAYLGIRDSATVMRLRGGTGTTSGDGGSAFLDITDFPKDGKVHVVVWDFQMSTGRIRLFIDGNLKGESFCSDGYFNSDLYANSNDGAYLADSVGYPSMVQGETSTASNFTEASEGLRVYVGQVVDY
jgi:hypothetical protein